MKKAIEVTYFSEGGFAMREMFCLITAIVSGTAVMQFCERIGMNVWLSRGIGAIVAGIVGVVVYNWIFGEKGNQR